MFLRLFFKATVLSGLSTFMNSLELTFFGGKSSDLLLEEADALIAVSWLEALEIVYDNDVLTVLHFHRVK